MGEKNEILLEINKIIMALSDESKEKKTELENLKATIKQQKADYNREIKEYNSLTKTILNEEAKMEEIEKYINKIRLKQMMAISVINNDFVKHFNDFSSRIPAEIFESLMEFFGYMITPYSLIKKIIKDESELKCAMEYSEAVNSYIESIINNKMKLNNTSVNMSDMMANANESKESKGETSMIQVYTQTKEKMLNIKTKYSNILQYPFDCICDHVLSIYQLLEKTEEKEIIMEKIENIHIKKNNVFMGLKGLESDILKNDNFYRNLSKYIKSIGNIFEKFKIMKELPDNDINKMDKLKDFLNQVKDFKRINVNNMRKYDNMNSLTLKSEYSEDYSEIISNVNADEFNINLLFPNNSKNMNNLTKVKEDKPSMKPNETIENIIQGLTRIKTEDDKFKMKNAKKVKNKKLKLSNANSDVDIVESKKLSNHVVNKLKNCGREGKYSLKPKPLASLNLKINIDKATNILSPRPEGNRSRTKYTFSSNSNPTKDNFGISHSSFKTESILRKNYVTSNFNNNEDTIMENVKQVTGSNKLETPGRRLSEEIASLNKINGSSINKRQSTEILPTSQNLLDKIESAASLLKNDNTFSPSTSSQSNFVFSSQVEQLDSVSDEWIISPLNRIPIRTSKLISEKPVRAKSFKSMPDYLNLKIDKPINNATGCCVSCV